MNDYDEVLEMLDNVQDQLIKIVAQVMIMQSFDRRIPMPPAKGFKLVDDDSVFCEQKGCAKCFDVGTQYQCVDCKMVAKETPRPMGVIPIDEPTTTEREVPPPTDGKPIPDASHLFNPDWEQNSGELGDLERPMSHGEALDMVQKTFFAEAADICTPQPAFGYGRLIATNDIAEGDAIVADMSTGKVTGYGRKWEPE